MLTDFKSKDFFLRLAARHLRPPSSTVRRLVLEGSDRLDLGRAIWRTRHFEAFFDALAHY